MVHIFIASKIPTLGIGLWPSVTLMICWIIREQCDAFRDRITSWSIGWIIYADKNIDYLLLNHQPQGEQDSYPLSRIPSDPDPQTFYPAHEITLKINRYQFFFFFDPCRVKEDVCIFRSILVHLLFLSQTLVTFSQENF